MAVTKHPQTRRGVQDPQLSWPNNTAMGSRRPSLKLLKKATHNRHKNRISNLSASSGNNVPKPTDHLPLHSQASRASGYSRHKVHKRAHRLEQQIKAPKVSGIPPTQNEKSVAQHSISHATQLPKASQGSSNSLTDNKAAANSHEDNHIGNPSPPSSLTSNIPQTDPRPVPAKGINWPAYERAKALRLKQIRIWIHSLHKSHRIVSPVAKELMAYYGSEKYGNHPSARTLSRHAWQAVKLCEHEFGTDLQWGKGLGEAVWGSEHGKVEKLIGLKMEGEGTPGVGTVGESDLSDFEDEKGGGEKGGGGVGGAGVGEDVEMGEAA